METTSIVSPGSSHKLISARKVGGGTANDLWAAARNGSIPDVDLALTLLKRSSGNVDARSVLGSTALHIAVWRNHLPIVRRLLAAGANPDARDGESGWSSLHRALHFGHLAVAGVLIEAGASLVLEDTKGRIPIDLISGPVNRAIANPLNSGLTEVYSWGNGANYQLGIGTAGIQRIPCRLDALQTLDVTYVAAAKFHSAAVTASGDVYTWGFGRGGRLGHPDFDIHSGQVAVIIPRQVTSGLVGKRVKVIAVAKHHTVISTDGGEVYTWGSNRDGRLGYPSVDTQATPRKVATLKARVAAVAAANKHSAVLTDCGEVYTWGCNSEGQLGYGTSNSASNCIPRLIDYLKGRQMVAISTAKYHTVVLGAEGEVMTWGYKMVTPRRVVVARDIRKKGLHPLKYHRADRLHVVAIAAGMTHSTAVTEDGLIFYWVSADPHLRPHQLSSMAGHQAVAVAAGKYRTAVATSTGNVYVWDGEGKADVRPSPVRVHGAKHITRLSVGETHSLAVASLYAPTYSTKPVTELPAVSKASGEGEESADEDADVEEESETLVAVAPSRVDEGIPSLKDLCQKVVADSIVEPKNVLQLLEFADSLGADHLKRYCEDLVLRNLDYILTISTSIYAQLPSALLAELEKVLDSSSSEPWSQRLLPTPSATLPVVIDSEEEDSDTCGDPRTRNLRVGSGELDLIGEKTSSEGFLLSRDTGGDNEVGKQLRAVRKKLQQIEALELKQLKGHDLDSQQLAKLLSKHDLEVSLSLLESGVLPPVTAVLKINSSPVEKEMKHAPGKAESTTTSKHNGRLGRKKSKGSAGRSQSDPPATVKSKEVIRDEDFDLQETLQQIALLESTGEPGQPSPSTPSLPEPQTPQKTLPPSVGFKEISGFSSAGLAASSDSWTNAQIPKSSSKKKAKKGGLSMFLSGALEAPPKLLITSPPSVPKADGPAWGGTHLPKGSSSLRDIQTQQSVQLIKSKRSVVSPVEISPSAKLISVGKAFNSEKGITGTSPSELTVKKANSVGKPAVLRNPILEKGEGSSAKSRTSHAVSSSVKTSSVAFSVSRVNLGRSELASELSIDEIDGSVLRVPLSEFVRSSAPIAVTFSKNSQGLHPENSPPAWAGRSPGTSAPLLRDIQVQQVKQHKAQQRPLASRGSPQLTSPLGSMISAPGGSSQISDHASPSTEAPNRWYKPEIVNPSPIRNIQKEEEAMKDLRRLYKSVKIVRPMEN
ncbi:hypothetical protein KC19_12G185700 [Ceratodon purpureus]|uniref:RCC1-like domain-containing protein n=1 Tax=Ceratodon purpureus TaxID=3225 RepID=A0A8T0GBC0_CERPU|nr:hypothetical protein KC19_12G185700 [Ceratodon purpureus]